MWDVEPTEKRWMLTASQTSTILVVVPVLTTTAFG